MMNEALVQSLTEPACITAALQLTQDWRLADSALWLATEGRRQTDLVILGDRLFNHLREAGVPLSRALLGFRTLNPLVLAASCEWHRDQPGTLVEATHATTDTDSYIGSPIEYIIEHKRAFRRRLAELDPTRDHPLLETMARGGGTDYLAVPLFRGEQVSTGLAVFVTDVAGGFSDAQLLKLGALCQLASPLVDALAAHHAAHSLLSAYLGPRTGERVLNGQFKRGDGERIRAAMWFSDLRESTTLSEQLELPDLLHTLNQYFELVAAAVTAHGGEILRFVGDAMLIVFAENDQASAEDACNAAVNAAEHAFSALDTLNITRQRQAEAPLRFGLGLHYGDVIYGNVGAPERLDFTVMGAAVNRTARLESLTKTLGQPLLMSSEFAANLDRETTSLGRHELRGVAIPQEIHALK